MPDQTLLDREEEQIASRPRSGGFSSSSPPPLQGRAPNQVQIGGHRPKPPAKAPEVSAPTATSAFTKVAPFLDFVVPEAGNSAAVDFELRIPVKGAFVGIHVAGSASRGEKDALKLAVEANVTAGATIGVAHATFELGAYLEVQGASSSSALVITSWVLYRQLAESNAPKEVENAWFGDKKTAAPEYDALVRKEHFHKDSGNWAEVGAQVAGSAKGTLGSAKGSVGGKLRAGRLYDNESIERREGAKSTTQEFTSLFGSKRGAQASLGDRIFSIIGTGEIDSDIAGGSLTVTLALRQIKDKRKGKGSTKTTYKLDKLLIDGTAHCKGMAELATATGGIEATLSLMAKVIKAMDKAMGSAKKQLEEESRAQKAGGAVADLDSMRDGLALASDQMKTGLNLNIPDLTASGQIHVIGGLQGGKFGFQVLFEKLTKLAMDLGVVSGKVVKTERLASIEYAKGKWVARLGGLSKELGSKSKSKPKSGSWVSATPSGAGGGGTGGTDS